MSGIGKRKVTEWFGEEALNRLASDLDYLTEVSTGSEKVFVEVVGSNSDTLQVSQSVHGVTQCVGIAEKSLPAFIKSLQTAMAQLGYTVTVRRD